MEEGLLQKEEEVQRCGEKNGGGGEVIMRSSWGVELGREVKRLGCIAAPMVAVTLSQYMTQVISMIMVGHLGELALSSTSIATSLSAVTGFSPLVCLPLLLLLLRLLLLLLNSSDISFFIFCGVSVFS